MELIISSFVLVVIFFILSIVLSGKGQRIAKEVLKELINGPEGKMLVGFFGSAAVTGVIFVIWLLLN
ncbi:MULTISPECIES: hypothetical protein [Bacillus]|uniref:Uncharacterized protein n=3 Tax=Bacillus cereus group TaxID=86661 RepID=A0A9W5NMM1_BACC8|nr:MULTISPECIES: hypothetical protein [Bacillus cereus group]AHZ54658.1 hypothetical protein YBT1520_30764 [Bacillus thuringiensis serovar kurstaki str. YBT-1520]AIE37715.1 hypothetical protein BTK_30609 [Bacillus thuringiensis serovar kurstaki str. HD-1]AIM34923.1 hypothetical protein DF16_pBMB400orf00088 [Bacillus thuringiensis serovar kurstaki str. YBT-1520]AJK37664.1 putative membrane protein [Bacillus thuringiensis serovar kurstaki]AKJ62585.1 hypothetical protein XI92_31010 [Bacillus thur